MSSNIKSSPKYYDITPEISEETAVFPGDTKFSRNVLMDVDNGDHLTLSSISTTVHIGAHADASNHYHKDGVGISERPLECYYGPCQVISVDVEAGARITLDKLGGKQITEERVLFYTGSFPDPEKWNSNFCSLSPELIEFLASKKVKLVGIDTPSVDPETSKELESHQAIYENDLAVLEGLVLADVPEGSYHLVALPLKIKGADASPVRAVLFPL